MGAEADLAYVSAGLLAASAVLHLFLPVLRHITMLAVNRVLSAAILAGMLLLAAGAIE